MTDDDRAEFMACYVSIQEFYGREPSPKVAGMWWDLARREVTLEEFQSAAMDHIRTSKFSPQLSEILDLVRSAKWPSPEDAWNQAPKSESETAWLCEETATALAACQDSIDRGDMIGARKAFLETYTATLRRVTGNPQWWISEATEGDLCTRQQDKARMLLAKPGRRPSLTTSQPSVPMIGSNSTRSGLHLVSDLIGFTSQEKTPSQS